MSSKTKIKEVFVELLQETQRRLDVCKTNGTIDWENFEFWRSACLNHIELTFGSNSRNFLEFQNIKFTADVKLTNLSLIIHKIGLSTAHQKLLAMMYAVETWLPEDQPSLLNPPNQPVLFIAHGRISRKQLQKMKDFLLALGVVPIIVIDEPDLGMTPKQKVQYYMASCNIGLALITADDRISNSDELRGRPNIDNEIGMFCESKNIENRIIIFKEPQIKLPSNYSELVWKEFNKGQIETTFTQIVRELKAWGFL